MSCAFTQTCLDGFFFSKTELHHIYVLVILMRYPIQDGCQFAILLASLSAMRSLSDRLIFRRRPSTFIVNFFKTAGQTHLILGIPVPRDDLIQICSNCDEICKSLKTLQFSYKVEKLMKCQCQSQSDFSISLFNRCRQNHWRGLWWMKINTLKK